MWGESVHCGMLRITEPTVTSGASAEPDTCTSVLIFSVWYLQLSAKCEDNSLAVSISNKCTSKANWKCACIPGTVYTSIPAHLPDLPFRFFEGLVPILNLNLVASFPCHHYQWPCPSFIPRPLPDFILQPWRKIGRRPGIIITSRTGNGGHG